MLVRLLLIVLIAGSAPVVRAQQPLLFENRSKPLQLQQPFLQKLQKTDSTALGSVYRHPGYRMPVLVPDTTYVAPIPVHRPDPAFRNRMPVNPLQSEVFVPESTPLNIPEYRLTPPNRQ